MDAHRSQIIGGDADEGHAQIIGGMQPNYWGGISPHPPPPPRSDGTARHARCRVIDYRIGIK